MATPPSNDDRCARSGYGHWRCPLPRFGGSRFCEKHHLYYRQKKSRARVSEPQIEKKKKKKKKKETPIDEDDFEARSAGSARARVSDPSMETKKKKKKRALELGQIWAFLDESDTSPQFYGRIDAIDHIGSSVQVTPLLPRPILDEETFFVERGLPLACGSFLASHSAIIKSITELARDVPFEKDEKESSLYRIFPGKGEIWAVYSRWNDSEKHFEYKLVEVVSDFNEEDGVTVFGLVHVEGNDRVYKRQVHEGFYLIRSFSRSFMPMFSHQVPASRTVVEGDQIVWKVMLHRGRILLVHCFVTLSKFI